MGKSWEKLRCKQRVCLKISELGRNFEGSSVTLPGILEVAKIFV